MEKPEMNDDRLQNSQEKPNAAAFAEERHKSLSHVTQKNRTKSIQRLTPAISGKASDAKYRESFIESEDDITESDETNAQTLGTQQTGAMSLHAESYDITNPHTTHTTVEQTNWSIMIVIILMSFALGMVFQSARQRN